MTPAILHLKYESLGRLIWEERWSTLEEAWDGDGMDATQILEAKTRVWTAIIKVDEHRESSRRGTS